MSFFLYKHNFLIIIQCKHKSCKNEIIYCMKNTIKSVVIVSIIIAMALTIFIAIDNASLMTNQNTKTYVRVTVVDLSNKPVHNAQVTIGNQSFFTDNNGCSPLIELSQLTNSYDSSITDWHTLNVVVTKDGFVPATVFNCVAYHLQTRNLTVRIYPQDSSTLPYVCYVESPPSAYVQQLIAK